MEMSTALLACWTGKECWGCFTKKLLPTISLKLAGGSSHLLNLISSKFTNQTWTFSLCMRTLRGCDGNFSSPCLSIIAFNLEQWVAELRIICSSTEKWSMARVVFHLVACLFLMCQGLEPGKVEYWCSKIKRAWWIQIIQICLSISLTKQSYFPVA